MKPIFKAALAGLVCLLVPWVGRAASFAVQPGDILIVNHGDNSVYRINPVTGESRKLATFRSPTDLALSTNGYLYVSEFEGTIQRLNLTNGTISAVNPGISLWTNVNGLALGPAGDLFLTWAGSNCVVRVDPVTGMGTNLSQGNLLSVPIGIDFLDATNLVVSSRASGRIVKVALADGAQSTIASGVGNPWGVAVDGTNIYVAAQDGKKLLRITGTTVTTVRTMEDPVFGIGIEANGNILVGEVLDVARVSPEGVLLRRFPGAFNEITGVEVSRIAVEGVVPNNPPSLEPIPDRTTDENAQVTFAATATDTDWPPQVWTFSLGAGAPTGASITTNGVFTWTPSEAQGPGSGPYAITVIVTDDGDPPLSASDTFTVTVNEVNTAPTIQTITNRSVTVGNLLTVEVMANDADQPSQTLAYELLPEVPDGAAISTSGVFTWTPTASQAPSTNVINVKVTDDWTPPLSATRSFTVVVHEINVAPVLDTITAKVVNERSRLSFTITATDANQPKQTFVFSLEGEFPAGATLTSGGQFAWTPGEIQGPSNYVISVKVTDSGNPPLSDTNSFSVQVNEVNASPVWGLIDDTNVLQGELLTFAVTAEDFDVPAQVLNYGFASNAPAGASLSPDGVFTWTPTPGQSPSTNVMWVKVTDNGTPSLSATQSLTVVVRASYSVEVGDILVADNGGGAVLRINPVSGARQHLGDFDQPTDLALAASGDLYVSELLGTIKRLNLANGTISTVNPNTALTEVWGLALDTSSGDLFATGATDDSVVTVNPALKTETVLSPIPPQPNLLSGPHGIDFLDSSHLVVSSFNNDRLVSVALADGAQTLLMEANGITFPWGVAASPAGIYVASWDQGIIQRVSGTVVTDLLSTGGTVQGLAVETSGAVLAGVSWTSNSLVRLNPDRSWSNLVASGLTGPITGIEVSKYSFGAGSGANTLPVPTNPGLAAMRNQPVSFSANKLATDADGDPLTFAVNPTSTSGGTVSLLAGVATYTPPQNFTGSDRFTYTVHDGRGGTADGTVAVTVSTGLAVSLNVVYGPVINGDLFVVRFAGVPGCAYTIESSIDLVTWVKRINVVAPTTDQGWGVGVCQFSEPTGGATQRYYRTVDPAY